LFNSFFVKYDNMKIYLASGYSVMNVKGRERESLWRGLGGIIDLGIG